MNIGKELALLQRLTITQLRARYAEVFGEGTNAHNRVFLLKRIAWRLQAQAEGDLSARARQRAAELANDADLRLASPRSSPLEAAVAEQSRVAARPRTSDERLPPPGTLLTREYKGGVVQVQVLDAGFEYAGETYKSLSAVAKAVTGQHCNGFHFFQLSKGMGR